MSDEGQPSEARFGDRFAVERVGDEGILIDLETGGYFQLNATATKACLALAESASATEATARAAQMLALPLERGAALLADVHAQLYQQPAARMEPVGPFRYRRHEDGYALVDDDRVVLTLDAGGRQLRLCVPVETLRFALVDYLRAVTPKLLYLHGITVLHASACVLPDGLCAFSGRSGAGKTTTAHAFRTAGCELVAEDLVVLAGANDEPRVLVDGERRAHAWARDAAAQIAVMPGATLDCDAVASAAAPGPSLPLAAIWFVDTGRRHGDQFTRRPLTVIEGTLALMANNFLGADDTPSWRRHVRDTLAIAARVSLWEATPPSGLNQLAAGARSYATKTAS